MGGMNLGHVTRGVGAMPGGGGMGGYLPSNMSDYHPLISDQNEFPALTNRNLSQGDSYHQSLPTKPYG